MLVTESAFEPRAVFFLDVLPVAIFDRLDGRFGPAENIHQNEARNYYHGYEQYQDFCRSLHLFIACNWAGSLCSHLILFIEPPRDCTAVVAD